MPLSSVSVVLFACGSVNHAAKKLELRAVTSDPQPEKADQDSQAVSVSPQLGISNFEFRETIAKLEANESVAI
jgi:hypothetical protein